MTTHIPALPYLIQINEPLQNINTEDGIVSLQVPNESLPEVVDVLIQTPVQEAPLALPEVEAVSDAPQEPIQVVPSTIAVDLTSNTEEGPCVFQIVYPQEFNLSPAANKLKRGRPKKKPGDVKSPNKESVPKSPKKPVKAAAGARTRCGRLVKMPKYIEQDFKKIDDSAIDEDLQTSDFPTTEEKENSKWDFEPVLKKPRTISAQYKCPKCRKAYLGKSRMIGHLKKFPEHGPLPDGHEALNFEIWNYLFDITQKCKSGQRGLKFCEEISNLLHNLQLLKSALFKRDVEGKNCVNIDKVLGNAIGLPPGSYMFDENELYKDVTVLKLITNSDFFKPNMTKHDVDCLKGPADHIMDISSEFSDLEMGSTSTGTLGLESNSGCNNVNVQNSNLNFMCGPSLLKPPTLDMNGGSPNNGPGIITESDGGFTIPKINNGHTRETNHQKKTYGECAEMRADLLTHNFLMPPLTDPKHSVDMIMTDVSDHSLLDNSSGSDEVMNVDQFVNERFKKIIEPDIELTPASLNLDLSGLELFQFNTS